ncbi:uncharacterized protein I303_102892 [Kwoniella dejecticola CBS 10117]|uniref:Uncharacterized protein n=1 Tax=Kwoniella dejecticola CBS 10117 TaxID=1296121 RepID=A0A1A6AA09_9TREE|nr:uncharacterized protein I303_02912 [Kwoniella dejecticola CBS 10117]OBR86891.1 hypothetical protein I303_02912 [Kwoniella dejecticola CBS 10117]
MVELANRNIAAALSGYIVPSLLPVPIVRLCPLVSSVVSLQWAVDEYQFLSSWLSTSHPNSPDVLPDWFRQWGPKSTLVLFSSFAWSAGGGLTNIYNLRNTPFKLDSAKMFYALGTVLAFGHMAFGPKALRLLHEIRNGDKDSDGAGNQEGKGRGKSMESLREWLSMHVVRTIITDLPAVVCFFVAALKAQGEL